MFKEKKHKKKTAKGQSQSCSVFFNRPLEHVVIWFAVISSYSSTSIPQQEDGSKRFSNLANPEEKHVSNAYICFGGGRIWDFDVALSTLSVCLIRSFQIHFMNNSPCRDKLYWFFYKIHYRRNDIEAEGKQTVYMFFKWIISDAICSRWPRLQVHSYQSRAQQGSQGPQLRTPVLVHVECMNSGGADGMGRCVMPCQASHLTSLQKHAQHNNCRISTTTDEDAVPTYYCCFFNIYWSETDLQGWTGMSIIQYRQSKVTVSLSGSSVTQGRRRWCSIPRTFTFVPSDKMNVWCCTTTPTVFTEP